MQETNILAKLLRKQAPSSLHQMTDKHDLFANRWTQHPKIPCKLQYSRSDIHDRDGGTSVQITLYTENEAEIWPSVLKTSSQV